MTELRRTLVEDVLWEPIPCLSPDDMANGLWEHTARPGDRSERLSGRCALSYRQNLLDGELGMITEDAASALSRHIPVVLGGGAGPQVIGTNARRVIAGVHDRDARPNWAVVQLPGNPMRVGEALAAAAAIDIAVALRQVSASPKPTAIGVFVDPSPESFGNGSSVRCHGGKYTS